MKISDFLKLVGQKGRTNYFVICPDDLGLSLLLQGALLPIATSEDIFFYDAEGVTKEKARQIENEARMASRSGSELSHFYIYHLQKLSTESVGPLLKAVEESRYSRFIFQTQSTPRKIHTLMSRSSVIRLPFMSRPSVLANMKALNHDAKAADTLGLYDGTLSGTIKALSMKDTLIQIRRETRRGLRGLAALYNQEVLNSLAFSVATNELTSVEEKEFLRRGDSHERKKLVLYLILGREG